MLGFCPGVRVHKGITIVFSLFRSHWLAVVYCLVLCSGSCEPVHEDRTDLCAHRKHQDVDRRKHFLGAVSVIYGPVICQFSSAGKHFLYLKTFVWNTHEINMDILFAV